jgi:hypothetical protein
VSGSSSGGSSGIGGGGGGLISPEDSNQITETASDEVGWWWSKSPPEVPVMLDLCDVVNRPHVTSETLNITRYSEDILRQTAGRQFLAAKFPNTVNTRIGEANPLKVTVMFSDGSTETYEYVTAISWKAVKDSFKAGESNQRCAAA